MNFKTGTWLPWHGSAKNIRLIVPALLAMALFGVQGFHSAKRESQTWDEAYAIAAGYLQVRHGDFSLLPENPPLLGILVSGPLALAGARLPSIPEADRQNLHPVSFGQQFFYSSGNSHRELLMLARLAVLSLSMLAVGAVVLWAGRLSGTSGAWLAAVLCSFEPTWLAHGKLAAWDGICTATLVLAAFSLAVFVERPSLPKALVAGVLAGAALAAKHTALLLVPSVAVLVVLTSVRPVRQLVQSEAARTITPGRQLLLWAALAVAAFLVIGASYNLTFRYDLYLHSISKIYRLTREDYQNFFWGRFQRDTFPLYYLGAALLKTPLGFLALYAAGLVALPLARKWASVLPALLLVLGIFAATVWNKHNLGIRHVLPAFPLLIVLSAGSLQLLQGASGPGFGSRAWRAGVVVLALLGAGESLNQAPHYLSFFNALAGGARGGIRYLDESNIDWGQDLIALAECQNRENIPLLALEYFGTASPEAYGVQWRPVEISEFIAPRPRTIYAISVHRLIRLPLFMGPEADWLKKFKPWKVAGESIYLYRF